jgi:DNA recombination protein RmuC
MDPALSAELLPLISVTLSGIGVVLLVVLLTRQTHTELFAAMESNGDRVARDLREEFARNREESGGTSRALREEVNSAMQLFGDLVLKRIAEMSQLQHAQGEALPRQLTALSEANEAKLETIRSAVGGHLAELKTDSAQQHGAARDELSRSMRTLGDALLARMTELATLQKQQLELFGANFATLSQSNEQKLEAMRGTVEQKLSELQRDNTAKLEQMRATVDEKLHATLEQRLGESFKLVSERLEQVHSGLGEMRSLATGVGDLKKVLSNIKTRGCWGEVQLGNLLEQMLTPEQFARNVTIRPESGERVEYAIKLPGRDEHGTPIWLPIDAKFPQAEYQRLIDAEERGDIEAAEAASTALEVSVRTEAKKISEKYLLPPHTTDFGIMFLPTEGLFAEVLRRPGLSDTILHTFHVVITGPTTLAAVLSSLQMGFRTLSIEKRSSEVWTILGAVKTEFGKFGVALEKVQKKLHEATNSIEDASRRSRAVERKLRSAEEMPALEATELLDIEGILEESLNGEAAS